MPLSNDLHNRFFKALKINAEKDVSIGTIEYLHNKVHEGKMLFVGDVLTVPNLGEVYIHYITGSTKYIHATVDVSSIGEWRFTSYEGTTYIDNGDELTQFNRKNDSSYVPEVKFYENLVGDIDVLGTQRLDFVFGSGTNPAKASSGLVSERLESIFSPGTDILIKLVNNSGSEQLITILYNYYEEE